MARIEPKDRSKLTELEPIFNQTQMLLGFLPNSMLTMAHKPELLKSFAAMAMTILKPDKVSMQLKTLVANAVSNAASCRYCQAHTAHKAHSLGLDKKLEAIFDYKSSLIFDDSERAAIKLAFGAGSLPNSVTDEDFEDMKKYFDTEQIVEIMAVISLYGFLNRWNDSIATTLEEVAEESAKNMLSDWEIGKHKRDV